MQQLHSKFVSVLLDLMCKPSLRGSSRVTCAVSDGTRNTYPRSPAVDTTDGLIESFRGIFCFIVKVKGTTQQIIYWRACTSLLCQTICQSSGPAHVTAAPGRLLSVTSAASSYTNIAINPCMNINRLGERERERERCHTHVLIARRDNKAATSAGTPSLHTILALIDYHSLPLLRLPQSYAHTALFIIFWRTDSKACGREKFFGIHFTTTRGTNKSTFITYTNELEYTVLL